MCKCAKYVKSLHTRKIIFYGYKKIILFLYIDRRGNFAHIAHIDLQYCRLRFANNDLVICAMFWRYAHKWGVYAEEARVEAPLA